MATARRPVAKRTKPEQPPLLAVCGDTGLKEWGGHIREEFHPHLTGDRFLKRAKEMAWNEGNIAASHFAIEMMLRSTPRTIRMNDSGHPMAPQAQEYVAECWEDMESTPQEVIGEACTAIQWGYAWLEITLKIRKGDYEDPRIRSQYRDGRYGWRDFMPIAQESRDKWEFDDGGNLLGMWQRSERCAELLFIPIDRSLHFKFRGQKQNPEGFSFYRPAYPSYYYAKRLREVEGISLERNGAGLPDMQVPPEIMDPNASTDQQSVKTAMQEFVRKVRMDELSGIVRPAETDARGNPTGYKFGLVASSGRNNAEFHAPIMRYQNEMLKAFLTQFLAFGTAQVGSHALSSDMTTMLGYAISAVNRTIDEEITRSAISKLMRLEGFPEDAWPYLDSADVETPKLTEAGAFIASMISSGAMEAGKDLDDWARKQIGLEANTGPSIEDLMTQVSGAQPQGVEDDQLAMTPAAPVTPRQQVLPLEQDAEPEDEPEKHPMMSADDAAEFLNVDRKKIMRAINTGRLPGIKIGNDFRIKREDLERLMMAGTL